MDLHFWTSKTRNKGIPIFRVNALSCTDVLVGQLFLSIGLENGPERGLKTVLFNSKLLAI